MNCCFDCQKRKPGCHSKCQEYKEWQAGHLAKKKKISEQKKSEYTHKKVYQRRKYGIR